MAYDVPNNAAEGDATFEVDVANTGRPGVITSEQFDQLTYLPTNDEGLAVSTQYAFVRILLKETLANGRQ